MAGPASCAPCVFGATSSNILTYPLSVGTVTQFVVPHVTVLNGTSITSLSTEIITEPGFITSFPPGAPSPTIISVTHPNDLTWSTLGTVLTYPTTYAQYVGFEGAAASSSAVCAQTLAPSALSVPATADPASFIYPSANTLPAALLNYLDGIGIPSQLQGDQLTTCATLGAPPPSSPTPISTITSNTTVTSFSTSLSTSTSTETLTTSTTIVTSTQITTSSAVTLTTSAPSSIAPSSSVLPGTTVITTPITTPVSTTEVVPTTQTLSHTSALVFSTVTGPTIIFGTGGSTTVPPTAIPISLPSGSPTTTASLGGLLSIIESLASNASPMVTPSMSVSAIGNSTNATVSTASVAIATGNSAPGAVGVPKWWLEWIGAGVPLLLLW